MRLIARLAEQITDEVEGAMADANVFIGMWK